jgi:hypothetical protein
VLRKYGPVALVVVAAVTAAGVVLLGGGGDGDPDARPAVTCWPAGRRGPLHRRPGCH